MIYLVDDESLLLDLAELTLLPEGYRVKKFDDPRIALKSFLRERSKPCLLITDYSMDSMTGLELIRRCKTAHPSLRSILLSGTAGPEILESSPVQIDHFVSKPYKPANLTQGVRQLLKSPPKPRPIQLADRRRASAASLSH